MVRSHHDLHTQLGRQDQMWAPAAGRAPVDLDLLVV